MGTMSALPSCSGVKYFCTFVKKKKNCWGVGGGTVTGIKNHCDVKHYGSVLWLQSHSPLSFTDVERVRERYISSVGCTSSWDWKGLHAKCLFVSILWQAVTYNQMCYKSLLQTDRVLSLKGLRAYFWVCSLCDMQSHVIRCATDFCSNLTGI